VRRWLFWLFNATLGRLPWVRALGHEDWQPRR
jgi:hypothetical protein